MPIVDENHLHIPNFLAAFDICLPPSLAYESIWARLYVIQGDTFSDLKSLESALIKVFKEVAPPGSNGGRVLALHHLVLRGKPRQGLNS